MGFLDAFARGAGGAGMLKVGDQLNRRDLLDQQRKEREADRDNQQRFQITMAKLNVELKGVEMAQADAFNNDPDRVARNRANKVADISAVGAAQNQLALEGATATAASPELNEALRKKAADDAKAAARTTRETVKDSAADPLFMKANWDLAMSDPRVKAAYAASMASAGASSAQAKVMGEQYNQLVQAGSVATKIRGLQGQLSQATDQAARDSIQQQISDLGFSGKDPSKFLALAEKAQDNVMSAMKVLLDPMADGAAKAAAKLQMERATDLSTRAAALGGIKLEYEGTGNGPPPPAAIEYLRKNPGSAADFDAYYGKGLAEKALSSTPAAPPATKKPAGGMLSLPGADHTPDSAEASVLDAARQVEAAANAKLRTYGRVQQQRDPTGYRQAVNAVEAAKEARLKADAAYKATVQGGNAGAAFRYAPP